MYVAEEVSEGKMLGKMWAAVIRNINNLLRTAAWLRTQPQLGKKKESVDAQKGTMLDIFARCLKKEMAQVCTLSSSVEHERGTFDQYHLYYCIAYQWVTSQETQCLHCNITVNNWMRNNLLNPFPCIYVQRNCPCYNRCLFFRRVENKPWIPWV
jgi:hypothetical protein